MWVGGWVGRRSPGCHTPPSPSPGNRKPCPADRPQPPLHRSPLVSCLGLHRGMGPIPTFKAKPAASRQMAAKPASAPARGTRAPAPAAAGKRNAGSGPRKAADPPTTPEPQRPAARPALRRAASTPGGPRRDGAGPADRDGVPEERRCARPCSAPDGPAAVPRAEAAAQGQVSRCARLNRAAVGGRRSAQALSDGEGLGGCEGRCRSVAGDAGVVGLCGRAPGAATERVTSRRCCGGGGGVARAPGQHTARGMATPRAPHAPSPTGHRGEAAMGGGRAAPGGGGGSGLSGPAQRLAVTRAPGTPGPAGTRTGRTAAPALGRP